MAKKDLAIKFSEILEKAKEEFMAPSISMAIYDGEDEFYLNTGFSNIEEEKETRKDTIYGIASASKAFIATGLCILAE